jgi:hypothetical protein
MENKQCFIIMPISTPPELIGVYSGDSDHFQHVLEFLFIPAIKQAGLTPIPPVAKGSELIHAEIVKNIENADYLLCDMSTLNANVFFELGIRTAVNKPVALVKDDATPKVPFDTNIINNHTYLNSLSPWTLANEIKKLADHLSECCQPKEKKNSLWKYFSLSSKVLPMEQPSSGDQKLDYLAMQVEAMRNELEKGKEIDLVPAYRGKRDESAEEILFHKLIQISNSAGVTINQAELAPGHLTIYSDVKLSPDFIERITDLATRDKIKLQVKQSKRKI